MRKLSRNMAVYAALLCLMALAPSAAQAAARQVVVKVTGQAEVHKTPEVAELTVGVVASAPEAARAAAEGALAMNKVLAAVKAKLGPDDKLQTVGYRLSAKTEWDPQTRTSKSAGFEAVNQVRVTSRRPEVIGQVLDAAAAAGANQISGPDWRLADPGAAQVEAQALAFADARAQARGLAKAAGMSLGPLIKVEAGGSGPPRPMARMALMESAAKNTPMEPGEVTVSAEVTCQFALQ